MWLTSCGLRSLNLAVPRSMKTASPWTRGDFRRGLGEPPLKAVFMLPGGASVSSSFSSSVFWEGTSEDEHDDEDDF
jgi:hypothetical protein